MLVGLRRSEAFLIAALLTLYVVFGTGLGWAGQVPLERSASSLDPSEVSNAGLSVDFYAGVKAYREGNYQQSEKIFEALHQQAPENAQYTYYLAITQAQLGRFQKAKQLYEEIVTLAPHGKAATLAQKGLDYLPKDNDLDLPPRFQSVQTPTEYSAAEPGLPPTQPSQSVAEAMRQGMQGMSPQDWMMMQMMQGQGQNNGQGNGMMGGMNPMSLMMMPGMSGANGSEGYDPSVMSNMMMNQMMQGFGMGGDPSGNP
ncbi:tol-pal system YbgF family protein [Vampirovibrio sp.]|uniref:tetratricopeptide repeat protein n=1 Tax=Vampirovibrio sp. TaxID=2717857 RepID=UPI003594456F